MGSSKYSCSADMTQDSLDVSGGQDLRIPSFSPHRGSLGRNGARLTTATTTHISWMVYFFCFGDKYVWRAEHHSPPQGILRRFVLKTRMSVCQEFEICFDYFLQATDILPFAFRSRGSAYDTPLLILAGMLSPRPATSCAGSCYAS